MNRLLRFRQLLSVNRSGLWVCRWPSSGTEPRLSPGLCASVRIAVRFHRSRRSTSDVLVSDRFCSTVDPLQEEQFVFLDYEEEEQRQEEENDLLLKEIQRSLAPSAPPEENRSSSRLRGGRLDIGLQRQLQSLSSPSRPVAAPDSGIEFQDVDFPLDELLSSSKRKRRKGEQKIFGTPDVDEPISNSCCSGCGAVLHCAAHDVAGFLPSEKYKVLLVENQLQNAVCQRCYLLTYHQRALTVTMTKEEYSRVVGGIKAHKALVLLIVDLLDLPDSIVPDLLDLVGRNKQIVVLGNKVDLLPKDSDNYLSRIKRQLAQFCSQAGFAANVQNVHLISAKTGYGIEDLISSLQKSWKYKGDVYLVGTANAGKSTLFNTLLDSDYCKSRGTDVIRKATISPWPGTTLNLLKFPIINPTPYRMFRRQERLSRVETETEEDLGPYERKSLRQFNKHGYLVGRVGRTFRAEVGSRTGFIEFDPDSLAYGEHEDGEMKGDSISEKKAEFSLNELKDAHWLYDTPGIIKDKDVLSLLTEKEVQAVVPTQAIVPRTFVLKPGMVLFLGALARIDYLQGEKSCWCSVVASNKLPVHVTSLEKADSVYQKHAGHTLLGVPMGGAERMKDFPLLVTQDFSLKGQGYLQAIADIKVSSAGWVAITGVEGELLKLRVHAPEDVGVGLRTPPLLPRVVTLKGARIRKSSAYKTMKSTARLDSPLSGLERKKRS